MKDIDPKREKDQDLNVGDDIRIFWRLDAQVDPNDVTFTVVNRRQQELSSYSGSELREEEKEIDGETFYVYSTLHKIEDTNEFYEFELDDGVQSSVDTAYLRSEKRLT